MLSVMLDDGCTWLSYILPLVSTRHTIFFVIIEDRRAEILCSPLGTMSAGTGGNASGHAKKNK